MKIGDKFKIDGVSYTVEKIQDVSSLKEFASTQQATLAGAQEKYIFVHNKEYNGCHQWIWLKTKLISKPSNHKQCK